MVNWIFCLLNRFKCLFDTNSYRNQSGSVYNNQKNSQFPSNDSINVVTITGFVDLAICQCVQKFIVVMIKILYCLMGDMGPVIFLD